MGILEKLNVFRRLTQLERDRADLARRVQLLEDAVTGKDGIKPVFDRIQRCARCGALHLGGCGLKVVAVAEREGFGLKPSQDVAIKGNKVRRTELACASCGAVIRSTGRNR